MLMIYKRNTTECKLLIQNVRRQHRQMKTQDKQSFDDPRAGFTDTD